MLIEMCASYILTEHNDLDFILQIWQIEMPKVAFQFDYVMHGLLGFSALHKAHLEPESAPRLRQSAVDHLDKALVLYRSETALATAENANAKFIFTWIVALFAYAIPPSLPPIGECQTLEISFWRSIAGFCYRID